MLKNNTAKNNTAKQKTAHKLIRAVFCLALD
jgi:hypothetical protein